MKESALVVNACISFLMIFGSGTFLFGMEDGQVVIARFNIIYGHHWILFLCGILFGISTFTGLFDNSEDNIRMAFKKVEKELNKLKKKL